MIIIIDEAENITPELIRALLDMNKTEAIKELPGRKNVLRVYRSDNGEYIRITNLELPPKQDETLHSMR